MESQEKNKNFVDLNEISKDQELNNLWDKFCEYEETDSDEEQYIIAESINKRLQDF